MLLAACEEANMDGAVPETDAAVALIAARVGFASPVNSMGREAMESLVDTCRFNLDTSIQLKKEAVQ